jgi:hypothetical protein
MKYQYQPYYSGLMIKESDKIPYPPLASIFYNISVHNQSRNLNLLPKPYNNQTPLQCCENSTWSLTIRILLVVCCYIRTAMATLV